MAVLGRAGLAMGGAALIVAGSVWAAQRAGVFVGPLWLAIGHGLAAALLARLLGLPWWWRLIVLLFAPLAFVAVLVQPPWWIWPLGLVLALLTYGSVFRTRVPLYLSGPAEWAALSEVLPSGPFTVLDVGSGLGGPLFWLARRRPDGRYTGIEIAVLPWLIGWLRARWSPAPRPVMLLGNADRLDLSRYDVVFAFLSPAAMPGLFARARATMRPGSQLVSCAFAVPEATPSQTIEVPHGRPLLVWRF
jgi:hypothetical protein